MELKHLLLLLGRLAVAALAASSALSAGANPIDTDNDHVFDDADDCPLRKGPAWNNGCPSNDWDVIVTGTPSGQIWAECPDGSIAAHWTACPTYSEGWGTFQVAYFGASGAYSHTETLADADGDTVVDEDDKCRETDGDPAFYGCEAREYCMETDTAYEKECLHWATANLSLNELGSYYERLRNFAEGGCGNDKYHWACYGVYRVQPINWASIWDTLKDYVVDTYGDGLIAPTCPEGYMAQYMSDPYSGFTFYAGSCINVCRHALHSAGLLTAASGSAVAIATTTAGKAAVTSAATAAGVSLSFDTLVPFCDGPTWVDPI